MGDSLLSPLVERRGLAMAMPLQLLSANCNLSKPWTGPNLVL